MCDYRASLDTKWVKLKRLLYYVIGLYTFSPAGPCRVPGQLPEGASLVLLCRVLVASPAFVRPAFACLWPWPCDTTGSGAVGRGLQSEDAVVVFARSCGSVCNKPPTHTKFAFASLKLVHCGLGVLLHHAGKRHFRAPTCTRCRRTSMRTGVDNRLALVFLLR